MDLSDKFDHQGRRLQDIEDERKEKEDFLKDMTRKIHETVIQAYERGTIVMEKFYFIHFNILVETAEIKSKFLPCEMAVAEFSLGKGVSRLLHTFIRPPAIPIGYSYEMQQLAEKTHKIELNLPCMTAKSAGCHSWIVRRLLSFINQDGDPKKMPPLYTMPVRL